MFPLNAILAQLVWNDPYTAVHDFLFRNFSLENLT